MVSSGSSHRASRSRPATRTNSQAASTSRNEKTSGRATSCSSSTTATSPMASAEAGTWPVSRSRMRYNHAQTTAKTRLRSTVTPK